MQKHIHVAEKAYISSTFLESADDGYDEVLMRRLEQASEQWNDAGSAHRDLVSVRLAAAPERHRAGTCDLSVLRVAFAVVRLRQIQQGHLTHRY